MVFKVDAACGSFIGNGRSNNEDNFYFNRKHLPERNKGLKNPIKYSGSTADIVMFAVFDGMGGEASGEVASFVSAEAMVKGAEQMKKYLLSPRPFFEQLCADMNRAVCEESSKLKFGRMGSTVASILFWGDMAYACNIGDSRIYRSRDNELLQISVDHVESLPPNSKHKAGLMQFLGMPEDEIRLEPSISKGELKKDDKFLICSDGITDMLSNIEICAIVKEHQSVKRIAEALIEQALKNGGKDNITAIVCKVR